jgi:hypothetical protein
VFLRRRVEREIDPLALLRSDVEFFVRWLEEERRFEPSTVSRRLSGLGARVPSGGTTAQREFRTGAMLRHRIA